MEDFPGKPTQAVFVMKKNVLVIINMDKNIFFK